MRELVSRGHRVFYFESRDLFWDRGSALAFLRPARLDVKKGYLDSPLLPEAVDLSSMDCIFIRKEPPFDTDYLYALELLNLIKHRTFILNDPYGIAVSNEKLFILNFPDLIPETLVTENISLMKRFIKSMRHAVVKPLDLKGGSGIFSASAGDKNLPSLLETATDHGRKKVMLQRFLPVSRTGDKRLLILDGEILGAFLRRPSSTDFRANISVGGSMHCSAVTKTDHRIAERLSGELVARGLWFVGIDIIGGMVTEINVTSPAGITDMRMLYRSKPEKKVADFVERRAGARAF